MTNAKAKTIQLLLYDGTLSGIINIADSAWNPGEMYASPRDNVNELISLDKYGVYLLLSTDRVYVGQAKDLKKRIKQHLAGKDWWERAILLTTQDDSFTRTDIDYLESVLIGRAEKAQSLESDNKNKGNNPKVDKFRKVILDQYLEEALFLMELIGINVFGNLKMKASSRRTRPIVTIASTVEAVNSKAPEGLVEPLNESIKCKLPDKNLGPCVFAKTALKKLLSSGYRFSDEQMLIFGSAEGSKRYTKRNLPLFWILKDGESRTMCDKSIRERYWKDEFISGKYRFLMFSQWYDDPRKGPTKDSFIEWYQTL